MMKQLLKEQNIILKWQKLIPKDCFQIYVKGAERDTGELSGSEYYSNLDIYNLNDHV